MACSKITGASVSSIRLTGKNTARKITSSDVLAIKLAGSRSDLDLSLAGASSIRGLCLFLAGNESRATVNVGVHLGSLVYIGRGNRSSANIVIEQGGSLGALAGDLNGNSANLSIFGGEDFPCETVLQRNSKSNFQCGS